MIDFLYNFCYTIIVPREEQKRKREGHSKKPERELI